MPTNTNILNTNSPICFHTVVEADTPSLTTGGEDANKECCYTIDVKQII